MAKTIQDISTIFATANREAQADPKLLESLRNDYYGVMSSRYNMTLDDFILAHRDDTLTPNKNIPCHGGLCNLINIPPH